MRDRLLAAMLYGLAPVAHATHPLVTDDPNTQGSGHHQIEANTDWGRQDDVRTRVGTFTYSYGTSDNVDVYVNVPLTFTAPSGINDLSLGAKWRFLESGTFSAAFKPELRLPTGDETRALGYGRPSVKLTAIAAVDLQPWRLLGNVGVAVNRYRLVADRDAMRSVVWQASVSLWYDLNEQWKLLGDVGIERGIVKAASAYPGFALVGLMYSPTPNLDFDAGLRFDLRCRSCSALSNRQVGVGLAARF